MTKKEFARTCSECGKGMNEGYCIGSGDDYYCSDACLHKHMTPAEYLELYADGEGDSYWTDWYDAEDDDDDDEIDTYHAWDCTPAELVAEIERQRTENRRLLAVLRAAGVPS